MYTLAPRLSFGRDQFQVGYSLVVKNWFKSHTLFVKFVEMRERIEISALRAVGKDGNDVVRESVKTNSGQARGKRSDPLIHFQVALFLYYSAASSWESHGRISRAGARRKKVKGGHAFWKFQKKDGNMRRQDGGRGEGKLERNEGGRAKMLRVEVHARRGRELLRGG